MALVVTLWVLAFALSNQTLDGFFLLASFPLIIWLVWRLVVAAVRRVRGSDRKSRAWPHGLETATDSFSFADQEADVLPGATTFYAGRFGLWTELIAVAGFAAIFALLDVGALRDVASGDFSDPLVWLFLPASLVFAVYVGRRTHRGLAYVFKRLPVLLLDGDGVECAWGRIGWRDIRSVGLVHHEKDRTEVVFVLFPGTAWQPVAAKYSDYTLRGRQAGQLRIRCLNVKAVMHAVAALRG